MLNALLYSLLGGNCLSPFGGCNPCSNYQCQPQCGYPEYGCNPYCSYPNYNYDNFPNPFLNCNSGCYPQNIYYSSCDCNCCNDTKKKHKKKSKDKKKCKCNSCNCNNCSSNNGCNCNCC